MSIIILEGSDCSGKTTLAKELQKRTGYEIVQGSSFQIAQLGVDGMYKYMMDLLDKDNIIIDRLYMSNYIYGKLYNYPKMTDQQFIDLAKKANEKAVLVYLYADKQTITERMLNRGDDEIDVKDVEVILEKYNEAINNPMISNKMTISIDTSKSAVNLLATLLSEMVQLQEFSMYIKN